MKTLRRHGALWVADDFCGIYFWMDELQEFVRFEPTERVKIVERKGEDEVVVE